MDVVTWTVAGGSLVFIVGLVSALSSRKQQEARESEKRSPAVMVIEETEHSQSLRKEDASSGGMNLAARGTGNLSPQESELASKYGRALAGAGQGK